MPRILLLVPTATYRAQDFMAAAQRLGVDVVVGSERRSALAATMGERCVVVPLSKPGAAVAAIVALHAGLPLDAVIAVDDQGVVIAAQAAAELGLAHNAPEAVAATRNKFAMRSLFAAGGVRQPEFRLTDLDGVAEAAVALGFPCVLKPLDRSGSQGVIRADDADAAAAAGIRISAITAEPDAPILIERFVPGAEVAVEGLLRSGDLETLAIFDKPNPLDGPYFEETIYVTPSTKPVATIRAIEAATAGAARALGLREGPIHAELRVAAGAAPYVIEVAARSIGGLCARSLRFGAGISVEEVIISHAIGLGHERIERAPGASGVMMLPIRSAGILESVTGRDEALAVPGVVGVEITIPPGRRVVPLPEGDRYLGFVFARGISPSEVEQSLRRAESCLGFHLRDHR